MCDPNKKIKREEPCDKFYIFIILHVEQFPPLIAKLRNEKIDKRYREIVEREFINRCGLRPAIHWTHFIIVDMRSSADDERFRVMWHHVKSKIQSDPHHNHLPLTPSASFNRCHYARRMRDRVQSRDGCRVERRDSSKAGSSRRRGE